MTEHNITDIAYASYLVSIGCPIEAVNRKGRKVVWQFKLSPEQVATAEAKWPSSESAKFYSTYQTLKTHIKGPKNAN